MKEDRLEKDALDVILHQLKNKSYLKQKTYGAVKEVFANLRREALEIVEALNQNNNIDASVVVGMTEISEFEFHVKFGGDLLVFVMKSNIVTFDKEYPIMQSEYMQERDDRKYFGSILTYNFMSDTLKYKRSEDNGYLLARMLVNVEKHFYIEGVRQLDFLFTDIQQNKVSSAWLKLFIEKLMATALDTDLIGLKYAALPKMMNYEKINQSLQLGTGQKIGFQMTYGDIGTS